MNKQLAVIAEFVGEGSFTLTDKPNVAYVGSLQYTLSSFKSNQYFFKMPSKLKHPMRKNLDESIQKAVNSLAGLFTVSGKDFLSCFSISYFLIVNDLDNSVSMQAYFQPKKQMKFTLSIPLFEKKEISYVSFILNASLNDYVLISREHDHKLKNLRHLYLLANFKHDIRQLLGDVANDMDITSDLLDMYFI